MKRYILTGTPGAGKTTILRALESLGCAVVEEAATHVIALEQALGIDEPWTDQEFVSKVLRLQKHREFLASSVPRPLLFFDRSPIDVYVLALYLGHQVPRELTEELNRIDRESVFERDVLFVQNLGFCEPSSARRMSYEDSLRFERLHERVYEERGFRLVRIAPGSVRERTAAVLGAVGGL